MPLKITYQFFFQKINIIRINKIKQAIADVFCFNSTINKQGLSKKVIVSHHSFLQWQLWRISLSPHIIKVHRPYTSSLVVPFHHRPIIKEKSLLYSFHALCSVEGILNLVYPFPLNYGLVNSTYKRMPRKAVRTDMEIIEYGYGFCWYFLTGIWQDGWL